MKRWISFLAVAALLLTSVPGMCLDVRATEAVPGVSEAAGGQSEEAGQSSADAAVKPDASGDSSEEGDAPGEPAAGGETGDDTGSPDNVNNGDTGETGGADTETRPDNLRGEENDIMPMSIGVPTGEIIVTLEAGLFFGSEVPFTAALHSENGEARTQEITLPVPSEDSRDAARTAAKFENLPAGTYTVEVNGGGFLPYSQEVSVKGDHTYEVRLSVGELPNLSSSNQNKPGLLVVGDVNNDETINEADQKLLMKAVDDAYTAPESGTFSDAKDLNQDGKLDLADLAYFAKGLNRKESEATIQTSVLPALVTTAEAAGTKVDAENSTLTLAELVNNTDTAKSVKLAPVDESGKSVPISTEHPVNVEFDLAKDVASGVDMDGIVIATGSDNPMTAGTVTIAYIDEQGRENHVEKTITAPVAQGIHFLTESEVQVTIDSHGNLVVNLNGQVAVKKVSLSITAMAKKNSSLAEISKVEFVNGMDKRIPEPDLSRPENLKAEAGNQEFTLTWDKCTNVTGYEVRIESVGGKKETIHEITHVNENTLNVSSFNGDKLKNYQTYKVKVQSVNGTWRSGYGGEIEVIPKPTGLPDPPDNLKVTGGYKSVSASWKDMSDAEFYNVYYKKSTDSEFVLYKERLEANNCTIEGLEDSVEYVVHVTGINDHGEGKPSLDAAATTTNIDPADMPKYKLINTGAPGTDDCHIISMTRKGGEMTDSGFDTDNQADTAWAAVDKDPTSSYYKNTWNDGGYWYLGDNGLFAEFDQEYDIDTITLQEVTPQGTEYYYAKVRSWTADGTVSETDAYVRKKKDSKDRVYYQLRLPKYVTAKKLQVGLGRYWTSATTSISEMNFYHYDSLLDEVMAMYADDLHTVLKEEVTQTTIDEFRKRADTPEGISGELNPDRETILKELDTAEKILKDQNLRASVTIHDTISTSDTNRGFGGLNAWQPLGVVAARDEELTVYVGSDNRKTGDGTNLQLVATQYHAESSAMSKVVMTLKVGPNQVKIPQIASTTGVESGGALYVQYTGNGNDHYAVRVSGGVQVPKLDLYHVTDRAERISRAKAYAEELEAYVAGMEAAHKEAHQNSGNSSVKYDYNEQNCILGASDILLDTMMLSLPAQQILAGAKTAGTSVDAQAERIVTSMEAMEEMMYLFYQHKGLNANAKESVDQIPKRHLNIRYQRMFSGAFMYASGDHIGIEYPETKGMIGAVPITSDNGKYVSGNYFGWGIAHEIGHCINQGTYAIAEVTNNYFSVLAQAKETNESVRFEYDNVYKKVTSGAKGAASNVFTQLGMYWQLHLAYDDGYNYKTYEDPEEQLENLFFARVDTYARTPSKAPNNGVALTLDGADREQALMRLCCAAAQKDILEFFERWGKTPDEETIAYAGQFEKETRAIYYVNDEARGYRLAGAGSSLAADGSTAAVGEDTTVSNVKGSGQVDFHLTNTLKNPDDLLGYEIIRGTISGGQMTKEVVGFSTKASYSDHISTMNNRAVYYEVAVIDKYLNRSAVKALAPIKIEHDGSLDKADWTISTSNLTATSKLPDKTADENDPCVPVVNAADAAIDQDAATTYTAKVEKETGKDKTAETPETAEITLEFNKELVVTGFKYTVTDGSPISGYTAYIRQSDGTWVEAASGTFDGSKAAAGETVYFENTDNKYISTYGATAMKLVLGKAGSGIAEGTEIAVSELDVLGVTGDNADFRRAGESQTAAIGILEEDYHYDSKNDENYIPKNSIVFTGSYKGNAAYNVVLLFDQDGNIVGGVDAKGDVNADQIILADVPDEGNIADVKNGTWIYWISPVDGKAPDVSALKSVRAELYRVNDAETNEGQRLVSDSLFETMPAELPTIRLSGGGTSSSGQ